MAVGLWKRLDRATRGKLLLALLLPAVLCLALAVLALVSPTAGERLRHMALTLTGVVFTPFFLEATLAAVGFVIVGVLAYLRAQLDEHDWEAAPACGKAAVAGSGEPGVAAEAGAFLAMAEGFLDLGSPAEAWDVLMRVPPEAWDDPECAALRLRHAAATHRWRDGAAALAQFSGAGAASETHAEAVARYKVAYARALLAGECGGADSGARAMARRLVGEAALGWPPIRPEIEADPGLTRSRGAI